MDRFKHTLAVLRQHAELRTLVALGLIAAAVLAVFWLAGEVLEGDTLAFDKAILTAMRAPGDPSQPIGPTWVQEMMRDFTAFGGVVPLTLITIAAAGFLWLLRQPRTMAFLLGAIASGWALSSLGKAVIARPRPDLFPHGSFVHTASFPSGHSMLSAITYLTLAVLIAPTLPRRALQTYVVVIAVLISLAVGVSRVYLGVHWPTDVLAGWAAGAGWALMCALLGQRLLPRPAAPMQRKSDPAAAAAGEGSERA